MRVVRYRMPDVKYLKGECGIKIIGKVYLPLTLEIDAFALLRQESDLSFGQAV